MPYTISGFWRRIGAFLIDTMILGLAGLALGVFFSRQFVEMGVWGRAVGFLIAAIYFAVLNSRIAGGQTIGKMALNIQTVDSNGELLSLPKSSLRYAVLGIPYFLNGAIVPETFLFPVGAYLLSVMVFGVGLSIVYLIVFNRHTRQSLHDAIAGTYVVRKDMPSGEPIQSTWKVHYGVCGVLMVLSLIAPIYVGHLSQSEFFAQLLKTRDEIQHVPQVVYATIHDGKSTYRPAGGEPSTTTYLRTNVSIKNENIEDETLASEIACVILKTHNAASERNIIQVVLSHGYDIGIASRWNNFSYSYSPAQWMALHKQGTPAVAETGVRKTVSGGHQVKK